MAKKPNPNPGSMDPHQKEFLKLLTSYQFQSQGSRQVFRDCVEMGAISLSNRLDYRPEREERYMRLVKNYTPDQLDSVARMFGYLTLSIHERWHDCLGEVYGDQELNIHEAGQFFTPYHVAQCMAKMTLLDVRAVIAEKGFVSLCEPAVGAGSLALASAEEIESQGFDLKETLCVTAIDINMTAVHMAYIQFSVRQIPARVIRGDALQRLDYPVEDFWLTPQYVLGRWWDWMRPAEEAQPEPEPVAQ